jgi:hypothetical protein
VIDGRVPLLVQRRLCRPYCVLSAEPLSPGLSGAIIFRCRDGQGRQYALRRWPAGTRARRLAEIHRVITVARQQGCDILPKLFAAEPLGGAHSNIPRGEDCQVDSDGYLWDLSDWMPGTPLNIDATSEQITLGAVGIAGFHRATRRLGVKNGCPPAAIARIRRCRELNQQLPTLLRATASSDPNLALPQDHPELARAVAAALQLLRLHWTRVNAEIIRSMASYENTAMPVQYVLRDVHSEHLLFCYEQQTQLSVKTGPTGLIDFDAIRMDTPMTDLARWVGSFAAASSDPTWEMAMAGYVENSPSPLAGQAEIQISLARNLAEATNWIGLANWVVWVVSERRIFPIEVESVAMRIANLVRFCRSGSLGGLR